MITGLKEEIANSQTTAITTPGDLKGRISNKGIAIFSSAAMTITLSKAMEGLSAESNNNNNRIMMIVVPDVGMVYLKEGTMIRMFRTGKGNSRQKGNNKWKDSNKRKGNSKWTGSSRWKDNNKMNNAGLSEGSLIHK